MTLILDIPEEIATLASSNGNDPSRSAIELFVLEAYRLRRISDGRAAELLGLGSKIVFHKLLKDHGIHFNYDVQDFEDDLATIDRLNLGASPTP